MVSMRSLENSRIGMCNLQIAIFSRYQEITAEKLRSLAFSSKKLFSIVCRNFFEFCESHVIRISRRLLLRMPQYLAYSFILLCPRFVPKAFHNSSLFLRYRILKILGFTSNFESDFRVDCLRRLTRKRT